jgi:hypothetical protein
MCDGSGYNNIDITDNRFQYGGGTLADGSLVYGISITIGNNATNITYNYFHDSPNSNRNWCIFSASNSHFDHNTFNNVFDGGQLQYIGANDTFDYNYATGLQNKLQEGDISGAQNFQAIGNVAYNWASTNTSSMGLSMLNNTGGTVAAGWSVEIENNYIDLALAGNQAGGTSGVVMELGGGPLTVSGNILGDATAPSIIQTNTPGTVGTNNQMFGANSWGAYSTEVGPGVAGGSWATSTGSYNVNLSAMPAAPANTNGYLGNGGGVGATSGATTKADTGSVNTGTTPSLSGTAAGISGFTATVLSDNSVQLSWAAPLTQLASAEVQITTTVGRQTFTSLVYQGSVNGATVLQLHAGWQYDFTILGTATNGATLNSQVLTIRTTGNPASTYALAPAAGTGTLTTGATIAGALAGSTTTTTGGSTSTTGGTNGTTTGVGAITGVAAKVLSDNSVQLAWTNPGVQLTSASIQIITTVGRQVFPAVVFNGNIDLAEIDQLHPGWKYDFTIVGTTTTGATVTSNVITVRTTGNSRLAYNLSPVAAPTTEAITGLTATVLSDTSVQLSWTNQNTTLTSALVNIITTIGRESYPGVTVTGDANGVIITGLHAGWSFDFSVTGTADDGSTLTSDVVTVQTTGSSTAVGDILGQLTLSNLLLAA